MTYQPLNEAQAVSLARKLGYFTDTETITCREIGDGNLNLVFHIIGTDKSIIIKQALPYAKVVGESWPLSLKRATIESQALQIQAKYVPHLVPQVYYHDEQLAVTVMEDLSHLTISRTGFIEGETYPLLSEHIGEFLAKTLFYTSDFGMDTQEKRVLDGNFVNPDLCKITEDLVFTDPFANIDTNAFEVALQPRVEELWANEELRLQVAQAKYKFLTCKEALLHGDLHTGSIFASKTETKVIDPEFATYGPMGFDLGQFFANLLLNAISRPYHERTILFEHIEKTWFVFVETFTDLWKREGKEAYTTSEKWLEHILQGVLNDTVLFAGCEVIRRTIGLAHVADLDGIENEVSRLRAKQHALRYGSALLLSKFPVHIAVFKEVLLQTSDEVTA